MSSIAVKYNNFAKIAAALPKATGVIVRKTAFDLLAASQSSMEGQKSGHMYGSHQASAPGEAPAVDTGYLKGSQFVEMVTPTSAIVGVVAEYGIHLEFGTVKMMARPFLRPAAEKVRAPFIYAMNKLEERLK